MKTTFKILALLVLLVLLLMPAAPAYAQGPKPGGGGRVIFGSNITVASGETQEGDLVVFGGNVTIEENASINGSVVVIGGTMKSSGETKGDVVAVGGQVNLEKSARVTGDVVTIGGQLQRAEGAKIEGQVVNNAAPDFTFPAGRVPPSAPEAPSAPSIPRPNFNINYNPFSEVFWIIFWAVIVSAFSMLVALFWQPQIERTGQAIVSQPLMSGAIGLLSFFVAAILVLTILPPLVIFFAWLFGVVALGLEVGGRFTKAVNQEWSPVLTIGFGTFLLMLVGGAIGMIPCLGGLILFLAGLVGVGGALITLFGTRSIQMPALSAFTPPAPPVGPGQSPPAS